MTELRIFSWNVTQILTVYAVRWNWSRISLPDPTSKKIKLLAVTGLTSNRG